MENNTTFARILFNSPSKCKKFIKKRQYWRKKYNWRIQWNNKNRLLSMTDNKY